MSHDDVFCDQIIHHEQKYREMGTGWEEPSEREKVPVVVVVVRRRWQTTSLCEAQRTSCACRQYGLTVRRGGNPLLSLHDLSKDNQVGGGHLNPNSISQSAFKSAEHLLLSGDCLNARQSAGVAVTGPQSIPSRSAKSLVKDRQNEVDLQENGNRYTVRVRGVHQSCMIQEIMSLATALFPESSPPHSFQQHLTMMDSSVRPLRFQGYGDCRSRCPIQGNKFDPLSLYGGLHGLSFDPTNTHALVCAVNALQSTKESRQCPVRTSCSDSPCQSSPCSSSKSSNSSDSLAAPSTPASIPCPYHESGPAQSIPVAEAVQTCSSNSTTSSSQGNSSQWMSQQGSRKGSVEVQVGVATSSKGSEKNGLTWIDWGWPGTHDPCPFNQRHTVDDSLIRPELVRFVITKNVQEVFTRDYATSS